MKTAIAFGTFDGLHGGHRAVIAETLPYNSIAVTFRIPPKSVILNKPELLILPEEREKRLYDLGVKQVVMQDFNDVRNIDAEEYLESICKKYNPQKIVCGFNYRFGLGAKGDTVLLNDFCRQNGIEFCCVKPQLDGDTVISSTFIRECIKNGRVEKANSLLYGGFSFLAEVIHGDARGRTLGFPTANYLYPELLVQAKFGVYISRIIVDGKSYDAITNIGIRPTFKTDSVRCETYIKDFSGDIYGKTVKTELVKFVRSEQKFNSLEELKSAITNDVNLFG